MGLYDGLSGLLTGVFGAPVKHLPQAGGEVMINSVFRREPVQVATGDGGSVMDSAPLWRVPAPAAAGVARGDLVEPGDGKQYEVVARQPDGSPAADAFVVFMLAEVAT